MGDRINELANVLNNQIKESGKRDVSVDFGTIEKNRFLITDILQTALGKDDYFVLHHIGELNEGDRVLVVWVYSDPVVVGKIRQEG